MANAQSSTVIVGRFAVGDRRVPAALQGQTVLYTTREEVEDNCKFTVIDDNKKAVKNKDGKAVWFGYDEYLRFMDDGFIDVNDNAQRIITQDIARWKMRLAQESAERARATEDENVTRYDMTEQKEIVKDPSAHLLSFFITCLIITLVVCLGRIFAPAIMEGVQGLLG